MQPIRPTAGALKDSGLDSFLYADVGTELNGSALTILSMIARLGGDPWDQAARWARLPKAAVIDGLTRSIAQMPLVPSALAETRATAARLALLLPAQTQSVWQGGAEPSDHSAASRRIAVTVVYCALVTGMALSVIFMPKPATPTVTPTRQAAGAKASGARAQSSGGGGAGASLNAAAPPAEQQAQRVPGKVEPSFPGVAPDLR